MPCWCMIEKHYVTEAGLISKSAVCTHVDDHADSGESSSQVLRVGRPHRHRDDPRIETAIEGSYQVDTCRSNRQTGTLSLKTMVLYYKQENKKTAVYNDVCVCVCVCVCVPGG